MEQLQRWSVGVIAEDRREPALDRTLESIDAAGLPRPRVFVDGEVSVPDPCPVSRHLRSTGGRPDFRLALRELASREPDADAYLIVKDGTVFCRGLMEYLSRAQWPDDCGVISLFCPACHNSAAGWHEMPVGHGMAHTPAIAFPADRVIDFIERSQAPERRQQTLESKHRRGDESNSIEAALSEWCELADLKVYTHSPSLSQYIGRDPAVDNGEWERRFADTFPGERLHIHDELSHYFQKLDHWLRHGGDARWTAPAALWTAIANDLTPESRTLETGSGLSTMLFQHRSSRHTSLEHARPWAERLLNAEPDCRASLQIRRLSGDPPWYDWDPGADVFDLILIDGPPGRVGRDGILRVIDQCVHDDSVIFLDDTNRDAEKELAIRIAEELGWKPRFSRGGRLGYCRITRETS